MNNTTSSFIKIKFFSFSRIFLLSLCLSSCHKDSVISITTDHNIRFQVIEGFGGFGSEKVWWSTTDEPFYSPHYIDRLINDLGITILRDEIPLGFEIKNDNDDPYSFDFDQVNINVDPPEAHTSVFNHLNYIRAMHEQGIEKLILSVWSPPLWMKYNNERGNGLGRGINSAPGFIKKPGDKKVNQLNSEFYLEFAEYCYAYIQLLKKHTGIDVYAISLQNEPRFSQWYSSAVYSPEALASLIAIVGNYFDQKGIQTKIFGPEDVAHFPSIEAYLHAILENQEANKHLDIIGIHGYKNDGVSASASGPKYWRKTQTIAASEGKALWLTETSGPKGEQFDDALRYAGTIYNGLYYGNVNAWVFWQMSGTGSKTLIQNGKPNWLYYISKHFYRHIRPGAIRIKSVSSDKELLTLSFLSKNGDYETTVVINNTVKDKTIAYTSRKGKAQCWQTTKQKKHETLSCGTGDGVSIPAESIITIKVNF